MPSPATTPTTPRVRPLAVTEFARAYDVRCLGHDSRHEEAPATHELILVRRGVFAWRDARGRAVADAGHALLAPAGLPYTVAHLGPGGDRCTVLAFPDDAGATPVAASPRTALRVLPPAAHLLHRRLAEGGDLAPLEREELMARLLAAALDGAGPLATRGRAATRAAHATMVEHVRADLAANPARGWTLAELARRAATSPYHLCRVFRARVGVPVHRYHVRLRLLFALDRWCAGAPDLAQAALDAGFSSHSHFTAAFRDEFGAPPTRALARRAVAAARRARS
jgi:AraC-like DNA-binding protein